jgi:ketosteroid isomerase-like protein
MKATLTSQEFTFIGSDWVYDRGTYAITATPKARGYPMTQEYKYLTLLHREPDGWKAKRDIYNSSKP